MIPSRVKPAEYKLHIPSAPYCTDSPERGVYVRRAENAIKCAFIQHNWPTLKPWLMFDVDSKWAWFLPEERGLPYPTFTAVNPANGHAHIGYLLESPVGFHDSNSREGPMRFYSAVERGFARRLGADLSYSGFLSKNPCNERWETDWCAKTEYRLDELNDSLDPKDKKWTPRKTETASGIFPINDPQTVQQKRRQRQDQGQKRGFQAER